MFPIASHVPNVFPSGFQYVPPKFPMSSPTCYPQHLTFIPYVLQMLSSFQLYQVGERGGILYFKIEPSIASMVSFVLSDGPIKLAYCNDTKKELTRHLIYLIGEVNRYWYPCSQHNVTYCYTLPLNSQSFPIQFHLIHEYIRCNMAILVSVQKPFKKNCSSKLESALSTFGGHKIMHFTPSPIDNC